jgi:hypothetical protein
MRLLRHLRNYVEEMLVMWILTKRNVALVDPDCGCVRSPDVRLSVPCPSPTHSRSTRLAFSALDRAEDDHDILVM